MGIIALIGKYLALVVLRWWGDLTECWRLLLKSLFAPSRAKGAQEAADFPTEKTSL